MMMNEISIKDVEGIFKLLFAEHGWILITGIFALVFQSSIKKLAASLFVFWGNDYKTDDVILLNNRPGRIIRVGFVKTTFFLYDVENGSITGGTKLVVQNEELAKLQIEKPLPLIDLSRFNNCVVAKQKKGN